MVGIHSFNEMYFDNVCVPKKNVIGDINMGWYYLMQALDFERLSMPIGAFRRQFEELIEFARETKRKGEPISSNPIVKNKLANLAIDVEIAYMFYFQTAWMLDRDLFPNVESSVLKLVATTLSRKLANVAMEIMGPYGQLQPTSKYAPLRGQVCLGYLDSISGVIGAGTSEIQRNIIAQRGLGLPRK